MIAGFEIAAQPPDRDRGGGRRSGRGRIRKTLPFPEKSQTLPEGGAKCGALDPEVAALADAWPSLPAAVKAGILAMVKATSGK
jgi:hypothetical protein